MAYELHLLDEAYNAEPARLQLRRRLEAAVPGPEGKKKWLEPGKYLVLTQREVYPVSPFLFEYEKVVKLGLLVLEM